MIRVKFNNQFAAWNWARQTPNSMCIWKDVQFFVNDDSVQECDYFIVQGGLTKAEKVICPKENVFFIALENKDIYCYHQKFLNQFAAVITHRRDIVHPRVINSIVPAFWFVGNRQLSDNTIEWSKSYDELKNTNLAGKKTKLISAISSNKTMTAGHVQRLEFTKALKAHFGDQIDIFGRGIRDIADKWDALADYQYHIVLENSSYVDEVTEKLYDTYLAQAFPIYYGAPNVGDYFPSASFETIGISNPGQAIAVIEQCIVQNKYQQSIDAITDAKELVLDKYNLFEIMRKIVKEQQAVNTEAESMVIKPERFYVEQRSFFRKVLDKLKA